MKIVDTMVRRFMMSFMRKSLLDIYRSTNEESVSRQISIVWRTNCKWSFTSLKNARFTLWISRFSARNSFTYCSFRGRMDFFISIYSNHHPFLIRRYLVLIILLLRIKALYLLLSVCADTHICRHSLSMVSGFPISLLSLTMGTSTFFVTSTCFSSM